MNSYDLSRAYFDWCFENPEKVSPNHTAIYFFAIEHCNRLGWKDKFGFPTQMAMEAIGIKKHQTYIKYFTDLVEWGFIKLVEKSKNQYSANVISLKSAMPKNGKALDKALIKHGAKQTESTGQSNSSIDKQETINKEQDTEQPQLIFIEPEKEKPLTNEQKAKIFYSEQIELSKEKPQSENYERFVNYLLKMNPTHVFKLRDQLSYDDFEKLKELEKMTGKSLKDKIDSLINNIEYSKNRVSAFLILQTWMKK